MKEDWTDKLRQRLEGHKAEPPADLWEGISKQMDLDVKPVRKAAISKRLYWTAAASVLALIGFYIYQNVDESSIDKPLLTEIAKQPVTPQEQAIQTASERKHSNEQPSLAHETRSQEPALIAQAVNSVQTTEKKSMEIPHSEQVEESTTAEDSSPAEPEVGGTTKSLESKTSVIAVTKSNDWDIEQYRSHNEQKWSISLNASGGLLAEKSAERMDRVSKSNDLIATQSSFTENSYSLTDHNSDYKEKEHITYTNTTIDAKHHLPVRLGVGVQYKLNDHLALLSGLNYTYLFSEFLHTQTTIVDHSIPHYHNDSYTQKLYYLGIPVGLSWKLWSSSRFSLYVAGQTMLEKCLNDNPWQWSVGASAGAEYGISRQLGLYLQPSFGYYFNDGSTSEHYYKEHPLAPSIEFGLKLHLNP